MRSLLFMIRVGVTSVTAVACQQTGDSPSAHARPAATAATASATPSGSAGAPPALRALMAEHFSRAASVKNAVIAGDLQASKEDAEWMAKHELSRSLPDRWRPHVQAMQAAAQRVVDATDTATAARATADMGQACGSCHRALGGPKFQVGSPPAEGSGAAIQMMRHEWAADRMWEGLIGPSDAAWVKGSEALGGAILIKKALEKSVPPEVESLARKIRDLGEKSRSAAPEERAALYGEFLGTCAECHSKLGVGKKK